MTDPHVGRWFISEFIQGSFQPVKYVYNSIKETTKESGNWFFFMLIKGNLLKMLMPEKLWLQSELKKQQQEILFVIQTHPIILESITFPEPVISLQLNLQPKRSGKNGTWP